MAFYLTSTSDIVRVITDASADIEVHASWLDVTGTPQVVTPGRTNTASITTATTTTVVGSPAASTQRNVKNLTITNNHASVTCTVGVEHFDGTTAEELMQVVLLAGENLVLNGEGNWIHHNVNGAIYTTGPLEVGRLLRAPQVLTSGTTYVAPTGAARIVVELWGGGGGGGGGDFTTPNMGFGGGGASGAYARKAFDIVAGTSYTYAIGVGGTAGANTGGTGGTGGSTTFAVGGTTVTALGGLGGVGQTGAAALAVVLGGAGQTATLGDFNGRGDCGRPAVRLSGILGGSGAGGATVWGGNGNGRITNGAGDAGLANTGGGAAGGAGVSADQLGGVGGSGLIIVTEYTS